MNTRIISLMMVATVIVAGCGKKDKDSEELFPEMDYNDSEVMSLADKEDAAEDLADQGIALYREGRNNEAQDLLLRSLDFYETGEAYFYLGNVSLNLWNYEEALSYYSNAVAMSYMMIDSKYNMACAYSLMNQPGKAFVILMKNIIDGDQKYDRIRTDSDLKNFRSSKYYNYVDDVISQLSDGSHPQLSRDLEEKLSQIKTIISTDCDTDEEALIFSRSGDFQKLDCEKDGAIYKGTWSIDDIDQILTITITEKGSKKFPLEKEEYDEPEVSEIPFNDIVIGIIELSYDEDEEVFRLQERLKFENGWTGDGDELILGNDLSEYEAPTDV